MPDTETTKSTTELLPVGRYDAVPTKHGFETIAKGERAGQRNYRVTLRVADGEHAGRTIDFSGGLGDDYIAKTIESLEHMGLDTNDLRAAKLTKMVRIKVKHSLDGKYANVQFVDPIRGQEAVDDGFAARLMQRVAAKRAGKEIPTEAELMPPPAEDDGGFPPDPDFA